MSIAFSPFKIRNLELCNHFMRSSTNEQKADDDGFPTPELKEYYVKLSEGHVGLIVTGFMHVHQKGKATEKQCGMYSDALARDWVSTVKKIHENGSKILVQLTHGGPGVVPPLEAVSAGDRGRPLTTEEVKEIEGWFVEAAKRCEKAGFDGIQLSSGHGYLLSTFLSPITNHRKDEYGGSPENMVRVVSNIAEGIRKATGPDFVIGIKLNGTDCIEGGVTPEIASKYVSILKDNFDFFEISSGLGVAKHVIRDVEKSETKQARPSRGEGYNIEAAAFIKKNNPDVIITGVGGVRTRVFIDEVLSSKKVDYISMARPFLEDPFYLDKLK